MSVIIRDMEMNLSDAQRKSYDKGWKAGQNPTPAKVEAADKRRENSFWYIGFFDAESGSTKYAGIPA